MATVDKPLAQKVAETNGYYMDDPRVHRIVEYDNVWGGIGYGLEYEHQIGKYSPSEFVRNPRVYWEAKD